MRKISQVAMHNRLNWRTIRVDVTAFINNDL